MIVIKIELWPEGSESEAEEIGRLHVQNTQDGTEEYGNYVVCEERYGPRIGPVFGCPRGPEHLWRLVVGAAVAYLAGTKP